MHIGKDSAFLSVHFSATPDQNSIWLRVIFLRLHSICFHHSDCLLWVFSERSNAASLFLTLPASVCQSKDRSPRSITKKSTIEPALFHLDFRRNLDMMWYHQHRECMFAQGIHSARKGNGKNARRHDKETNKWDKIGLNDPVVNVMLPFNTLWTRTVPPVCVWLSG